MDDNKKATTPEQKRAFWRAHIEAWKLGDLGQKVYCAQHGITHTSFQNWRRRFKYEDDIVERRARSKRKKMPVHIASAPQHQTLLDERVAYLRARIVNQNPAVGKESRAGNESRISSVPQSDGVRPGAVEHPGGHHRRTTVEHFAGLDVAMEETAVCVIDNDGKVVLEINVPTDPEKIALTLGAYGQTLRNVGHEAGSLSPWLHPAIEDLGVPIVCLEARQVRAAMAAQRNKTDQHDARALAQIVRTGWYRQVHIKSQESYRLRLLLTQRRTLKQKHLDIENSIRHSLKAFGIRLTRVARGTFEARVRELIAGDELMCGMIEPMLKVRKVMWEEYGKLHKFLVHLVGQDEVCRRFMAIPGVGPVVAMTVKTALDDPSRFRRSKNVAAYFGLTSRRWQTGTSFDVQGRISKMGDGDVRRALVEAASALMTRFQGWTTLKAWGMKLAKSRGHKRALVAVARKLATIMFAMWRDGSEYHWTAAKDGKTWSAEAELKQLETALASA